MRVCVCKCTCVCVCVHACVCMCACVCAHTRMCVCSCVLVYMCMHVYVLPYATMSPSGGWFCHTPTIKGSCNPAAVHHCCTMQVHRAAETKIHHISPSLLSPPTPSDRLAHRLVFEEKIVVAKDANVKNVGSYDIHDPRNPMTQWRREKPKHRRKHY